MRVAVGGIVRDRWTVPAYLEAMRALRPGPHQIVWTWVLDGPEVGPMDGGWPGEAAVIRADIPGPHYERVPAKSDVLRRTYERLGCLRNLLAQAALSMDCEALLSVDSDIVVPPDLLVSLTEANREWCAALVRNSVQDPNCYNVFHLTDIQRQGGLVKHFPCVGTGAEGKSWPEMEPWDHDPRDRDRMRNLAAGAVCLYGRKLLSVARWHSDLRGRQEDIGFAIDARRAGYTASYLPIVCRHLTVDGTG